jgi:hypothetical protein
VSSTIVEVGSVAGSDIMASLAARGLDTSELQSASNSIDGDYAADTSLSELAPEASFASPMQEIPISKDTSVAGSQNTVAEVSASTAADAGSGPFSMGQSPSLQSPVQHISPSLPLIQQNTLSQPLIQQNTPSQPLAHQNILSQPLVQQTPPSMQQVQNTPSMAPFVAQTPAVQPLAPSQPLLQAPLGQLTPSQPAQQPTSSLFPSKGVSSVSPSLGIPEPAFLAAYSATGVFNRAYVPNPSLPPTHDLTLNSFSLVSYNILAECHRKNSNYR